MSKSSIEERFQFNLIGTIIMTVLMLVPEITIIVDRQKVIDDWGFTWWIVGVVAFFILFVAICVNSIKDIMVLLEDRNAVKQKEFVTIVGKVVGFKENRMPDSGIQINNIPIILTSDTNEKIELDIYEENVKIGETYKFQFLENSKIGEVVEHIEANPNINS